MTDYGPRIASLERQILDLHVTIAELVKLVRAEVETRNRLAAAMAPTYTPVVHHGSRR